MLSREYHRDHPMAAGRLVVVVLDAPPTKHSFKCVENYYHKP